MDVYVDLSADSKSIVSVFASPQSLADYPNFATIPDTDPRYVARQAFAAARKAYQAALSGAVVITSTSTSALNGAYGIDRNNVSQEALYIQVTGKFTNGQPTKGWADASGTLHTFAPAQFISFAEAVAQYVDDLDVALEEVAAGAAWVAPSNALTIP